MHLNLDTKLTSKEKPYFAIALDEKTEEVFICVRNPEYICQFCVMQGCCAFKRRL